MKSAFLFAFLLATVVPVCSVSANHMSESDDDSSKSKWEGELDKKKRKNGKWVYRDKSGKVLRVAHYKRNRLEGVYQIFSEKGVKLVEKSYKNDILHGPYYLFYDSGKRKTFKHYDNGVLVNRYFVYHDNLNNTIAWEGAYRKGRKHGVWIKRSNAGHPLSSIQYVDGDKQGVRTEFRNGLAYYLSEYKKDQLDGKVVQYFLNKPGVIKYQGSYSKGRKTGAWTYWSSKSRIKSEIINYRNGRRTGKRVKFDETGKQWKVYHYVDNDLNGPFVQFIKGRKYIQGQFKDNHKSGKWTTWYPNRQGRIYKIENYVKDRLHGEFLAYYENGRLWKKEQYFNGQKHGEFISYFDLPGRLKFYQGSYFKNQKQGKWRYWYDKRGVIRLVEHYQNDERHGAYIKYYMSGRIWYRQNYEKDHLNGKYIEYYDSRRQQRKRTGRYSRGRKVGWWTQWDRNGITPIRSKKYKFELEDLPSG